MYDFVIYMWVVFILLCLANASHLPKVDIDHLIEHPALFNASKPFIISNAVQYPKRVGSLKWLKKTYGERIADFFLNNLDKEGAGLYLYTFEKALSELRPPQYLHLQMVPKDWTKLALTIHPWFMREQWLKALTPAQIEEFNVKTHWKVLLIGTPGAGMFNHSDGLRSSSWHLHVRGRKKWTICYHGDCTTDILEPGEVLFYPKDYWHQTECLDNPTITVTDTIRTAENRRALEGQFYKQCISPQKEFLFSAALCDGLEAATGWNSWRDRASEQTVEMRASENFLGSNYDGRNYITR